MRVYTHIAENPSSGHDPKSFDGGYCWPLVQRHSQSAGAADEDSECEDGPESRIPRCNVPRPSARGSASPLASPELVGLLQPPLCIHMRMGMHKEQRDTCVRPHAGASACVSTQLHTCAGMRT